MIKRRKTVARPDAAFPKLLRQLGLVPDSTVFNARAQQYAVLAGKLERATERQKRLREAGK